VLLAGVVCLAGWQVWLTVRLLEQDRNLQEQRSRERLGTIGDLAVVRLAMVTSGLRGRNELPPLPGLEASFPKGGIFLLISRKGTVVYPPRPLLFAPTLPAAKEVPANAFDAADELELREQKFDQAIAALQPLAHRSATRPEALLRIARIYSKTNRQGSALDTYQSLMGETAINPSGIPYTVLAAAARCRILIAQNRKREAATEADAFRAGLLDGRWPLDREAFEYQWSKLNQLGISVRQPPQEAIDFALLVGRLYERWQSNQAHGSGAHGWELQPDSSPVFWNATPDRLSALIAPPDWLSATMTLRANAGDVRFRLLMPGSAAAPGMSVTRSLADAQLPGRLELTTVWPNLSDDSSRRRLLLAGAGLMLLVVLGSGYVVHRAISRELRVAQLQSDFVAAVSHEFRSPLTTLRTITELLAQNRITAESHRQQSYIFLDRETMRLHQMVENLLDFGRMESGRKLYRVEAHDAFQLVRATVADFSEQAVANGFQVEAEIGAEGKPAAAKIEVDEEAFRRALRNLLDNAVKYSPVCRTVWVNGAVEDHRVLISVRDQGMGIEANERRAIFQKFVRGEAVKREGIKGTGIGLAMVRQICEAMGGEIRLQSEAGVGSTFTMVLPLVED
jgi:signal transduction histidine kinase